MFFRRTFIIGLVFLFLSNSLYLSTAVVKPVTNTMNPKLSSKNIQALKAASLKGVTYKYKPGIKYISSNLDYGIQQAGVSGGIADTSILDMQAKPGTVVKSLNKNLGKLSNDSGSQYPEGTKFFVLNKNNSLKPMVGDVYVDKARNTAMKILDTSVKNSSGNFCYPITEPVVTDLFEEFIIPMQTVKVNDNNIVNMSPAFKIVQSSGLTSQNGNVKYMAVTQTSDAITIQLDKPLVIFEGGNGGSLGSGNPSGVKSSDNLDYSSVSQSSAGGTVGSTDAISIDPNANSGSGGMENMGTEGSSGSGGGAGGGAGGGVNSGQGGINASGGVEGTSGNTPGAADNGNEALMEGSKGSGDDTGSYQEYDPNQDPGKIAAGSAQGVSGTSGNTNTGTASSNGASGSTSSGSSYTKVQLTKAMIKIYKPAITTDVNIGPIEQKIKVTMDSQIDVAATLDGEIHLKKDVLIKLFDYQLTASNDSLVYVSIFLNIGVDGNAKITTNINTSGIMTNGIYAGAIFGIPAAIVPLGYYTPKTFECGIEATSDLSLSIAGTVQSGLQVFGVKLASIQLWAGLTGKCVFSPGSSGGSGGVPGKSACFKVDNRIVITGSIYKYQINLLDKTIPIFNKNMSSNSPDGAMMAQTVNNVWSKTYHYSQIELERADAYRNLVEGRLNVDGKPYKSAAGSVKIIVMESDEYGYPDTSKGTEYTTASDIYGKFKVTVPLNINNYVYVKFDETTAGSVTWGRSASLKAGSPFDVITLDPDAFNDVLKGSISGKYSDLDGIPNTNDEVYYNGPVDIEVSNWTDNDVDTYTVTAKKGEFSLKVPLTGNNYVTAKIHPFGNTEEEITASEVPNLNALDFRIARELTQTAPDRMLTINGAMYNKAGSKQYDGDVKLYWKDFSKTLEMSEAANGGFILVPDKSGSSTKSPVGAAKPSVKIKKLTTPESTFSFENVPDIKIKSFGGDQQYIYVTVEYDGIIKRLGWRGWKDAEIHVPSEKEVFESFIDDRVYPEQFNQMDIMQFDNKVLNENMNIGAGVQKKY